MAFPDSARHRMPWIMVITAVLATASCHVRHPETFRPVSSMRCREIFRERRENTESVRAEARLQVTSRGEVYPGRMNLVWKRPERLRADFFDPFGRMKGIVLISGKRIMDYFPEKTIDELNFRTLVSKLSISSDHHGVPAEVVSSLMTGLPGGFCESSQYRWSETGSTAEECFTIGRANTSDIVLSLYRGTPVISKILISDNSSDYPLVIQYKKYRMVDTIPLPMNVSISDPGHDWTIDLKYRHIELNIEADDELFAIEGDREP